MFYIAESSNASNDVTKPDLKRPRVEVETYKQLEAENKALRKGIADTIIKYNQSEEECMGLAIDVSGLNDKNDQLTKKLNQSMNQIEVMNKEIGLFQTETEAFIDEISYHEVENDGLLEELGQSQTQNEGLNERINRYKGKNKKLRRLVRQFKTQNSDFGKQVADLTFQNNKLNKDLIESEAKNKSLEEKHFKLESDHEDVAKQMDGLRSQVDVLRSELEEKTIHNDTLIKQFGNVMRLMIKRNLPFARRLVQDSLSPLEDPILVTALIKTLPTSLGFIFTDNFNYKTTDNLSQSTIKKRATVHHANSGLKKPIFGKQLLNAKKCVVKISEDEQKIANEYLNELDSIEVQKVLVSDIEEQVDPAISYLKVSKTANVQPNLDLSPVQGSICQIQKVLDKSHFNKRTNSTEVVASNVDIKLFKGGPKEVLNPKLRNKIKIYEEKLAARDQFSGKTTQGVDPFGLITNSGVVVPEVSNLVKLGICTLFSDVHSTPATLKEISTPVCKTEDTKDDIICLYANLDRCKGNVLAPGNSHPQQVLLTDQEMKLKKIEVLKSDKPNIVKMSRIYFSCAEDSISPFVTRNAVLEFSSHLLVDLKGAPIIEYFCSSKVRQIWRLCHPRMKPATAKGGSCNLQVALDARKVTDACDESPNYKRFAKRYPLEVEIADFRQDKSIGESLYDRLFEEAYNFACTYTYSSQTGFCPGGKDVRLEFYTACLLMPLGLINFFVQHYGVSHYFGALIFLCMFSRKNRSFVKSGRKRPDCTEISADNDFDFDCRRYFMLDDDIENKKNL